MTKYTLVLHVDGENIQIIGTNALGQARACAVFQHTTLELVLEIMDAEMLSTHSDDEDGE